jgi:hypothetical protein
LQGAPAGSTGNAGARHVYGLIKPLESTLAPPVSKSAINRNRRASAALPNHIVGTTRLETSLECDWIQQSQNVFACIRIEVVHENRTRRAQVFRQGELGITQNNLATVFNAKLTADLQRDSNADRLFSVFHCVSSQY